MLLEHITSPADVKSLEESQLPALCAEIRQAILTSSSVVGGHIGSNLGAVELTVALHRVFDSPADKLVFDVSHQTYAHKMLTGRAGNYLDPRQFGGLSGFTNPAESEHDLFSIGHTSTSISLVCGMAKARDVLGQSHDVVAIIGDGSLSGGLAFEGLDNLAELGSGVIVIINDNGWSIAENHGGIYRNLAELRATGGESPRNFFRSLGLDYRYVEQGNDVLSVERALTDARGTDHPIVIHLRTVKGAGYDPATAAAEDWHHVGPFDIEAGTYQSLRRGAGDKAETYADITGDFLLERMAADRGVVAITAATPYIMGFTPQRRAQAGAQLVDVGIAEEHAVTYATGLARAGAKPVLGLYGVFMQRAYDQLWHDLCLNSAAATILDFGASVHGTSDATHLGFFDIAMLGALPNLICLAPTCREEYLAMLDWAIDYTERPVVIRVPGNGVKSRPAFAPSDGVSFDRASYHVTRHGAGVAILALGSFYELGEQVVHELSRHGIEPTLVNPCFVTDFDDEFLQGLAREHHVVVTLEDGVLEGGWGEKITRILGPTGVRTLCYGIRKSFPDRFQVDDLLAENGITVDEICSDIECVLADVH